MDVTEKMTAIAAAMASPSRLKMLEALAGGIARSAIDLAAIAGIQPNTASTHLQSLCKAELVKVLKQGRYRYFQIKDQRVNDLLESLGEQSGKNTAATIAPMSDMAFSRTCYDHLAGWLGVQLCDCLSRNGYITQNQKVFDLTNSGVAFLGGLGIEIDEVRKSRRVFARACQDWTEGEAHIGGALGVAIFEYIEKHNWVEKNKDYREVYILPKGKRNFNKVFGMKL